MKKYDLSSIMSAAWRIFHKGVQSFAVALRMAWANAKAHNAAKANAGITEETHTWGRLEEPGLRSHPRLHGPVQGHRQRPRHQEGHPGSQLLRSISGTARIRKAPCITADQSTMQRA